MSQEGRGATQIRRSANVDWICSRMSPRADMETVPFVGTVQGELPGLGWCTPEVRRRDVGAQTYGKGTPAQLGAKVTIWNLYDVKQKPKYTTFATSHGDLNLSSNAPKTDFLPTAGAVNFLSSTQGTSQPYAPVRYFPI